MPEQKTKPTKASVAAYLAAIDDPIRRKDCRTISAIMKKVTGASPKMWGPSIVGFGTYHYKYASGHEGDSCVVGFASRKGEITVYLLPGYESPEMKALLAQLGKHRTGKACLYLKRMADVDPAVLERMVKYSVAETRRRYPSRGS
ncbi:MAG: DUF1801 domain-containing protein [Gemmatimonadales bacterium]|nr:DUF1801 domain-containing protein [Gemmatimonadales bacterium]